MPTAHLLMDLPEGVPEWVHLLPVGTFEANDGRGPWTVKDPGAVIAASMVNGAQPPVDENHSTQVASQAGQPSPARGRIVAMEARADGIWGRVEWNATGQQLLNEKSYRHISPVFTHGAIKDGGIVEAIQSAALTNFPGLPQLQSLFTQETGMDLVQLRTALGLPETADEAACLTSIGALRAAASTHTAQLTSIATAAGLEASAPVERLVAALTAQRAGMSDTARLNETIVTLQTEVATLTAGAAQEKAVAFVDGAIKAGKPIVPTLDYWIGRHRQDPAGTETALNALPSINAGGMVAPGNREGGGEEPSAQEKLTAKMMGIDPAKLADQRKKRETEGVFV